MNKTFTIRVTNSSVFKRKYYWFHILFSTLTFISAYFLWFISLLHGFIFFSIMINLSLLFFVVFSVFHHSYFLLLTPSFLLLLFSWFSITVCFIIIPLRLNSSLIFLWVRRLERPKSMHFSSFIHSKSIGNFKSYFVWLIKKNLKFVYCTSSLFWNFVLGFSWNGVLQQLQEVAFYPKSKLNKIFHLWKILVL